MATLGFAQLCSWGTLYYSYPLIVEAMGRDLGWTKTQLYGPATVGLILAALAAYPVGLAIDRGHGRRIMTGASVVAAALLAMWSQVHTVTTFALLVAVLGALQAATLYEAVFAVVAHQAAPPAIRTSITTLTLWGGFASTLFVPLVQGVLGIATWREALLVPALVNALICAPAYFFSIKRSKPATRLAREALPALSNTQALQSPIFWWLAVALTAYSIMFSAFTFHMYPMLLEQGLTAADVVRAIAVLGPAQVLGRLLISLFASRVSMRRIGMLIVGLFPVVFLAMSTASANWWIAAGLCAAYGAANGVFTIVRGLAVPEMLAGHAYGAINGLLTAPATLARALAPAGAAWLWMMGNNYGPVQVGITASAVLLAVAFWLAAYQGRTKLQ